MFLGPNGEQNIPEGFEYDKERAIWKYSKHVDENYGNDSENSSVKGTPRNKRERSHEPEITPFKAREIPKEVKIDVKESSPLKRHKKKLDEMKNKKSSMNLNALLLSLDPPKDSFSKENLTSQLSVVSRSQSKPRRRMQTQKNLFDL